MKDNGQMGIYEDSGGFHSRPHVANQWYHVSLALNWTTKKVGYSVDGQLVEANIPFRSASVNALSVVYLYNFMSAQAWWDEISFRTGAGTGYVPAGSIVSVPITPSPFERWGALTFSKTTPANTTLTVDVLNGSGALLAGNVASGTDLSAAGITQTPIKLRGNLATSSQSATPALHDWRVAWQTSRFDIESDWSNVEHSTQDAAPAVNAGADATVGIGQGLAWGGSFADADADTWTATVDYDDGAGPVPLALNPDRTFSLSHTYDDPGIYTVTVQVTDEHGAAGSDTAQVTARGPTLQGTAGDDTFCVRLDDMGTNVEFYERCEPPAEATFRIPRSLVDEIVVNGGSGQDRLTIDGAAVSFAQDIRARTDNLHLMATNGAVVNLSAPQHLAELEIDSSASVKLLGGGESETGGRVLRTSGLTIQSNGVLDLNDNELIVDTAPGNHGAVYADIVAKLRSGLNEAAGYWDGDGITSSAARDDAEYLTGLGSINNREFYTGSPIYTEFAGEQVDENAILVKYTYYGDNDLSGHVDLDTDFSLFVDGFSGCQSEPPAEWFLENLWLFGDYNYDRVVDLANDFSMFVSGLSNQGGGLGGGEVQGAR
jgi:hypothetical protein